MKRISFLLPAAVLGSLLGLSRPAHAQNPAMSLIGSVQSVERQPLAGAAITVIHMPSGVRHATASDASGRFVVPNLMVGGPYIVQVGEGGYRPQTVENIFLESGKTTNFTVTLNKLGSNKDRANRESRATAPTPTLALASEATVGGPVLITTLSAPGKSNGLSSVSSTTSGGMAPTAATVPAASHSAPAPVHAAAPGAPAPAPVAAAAPAAAAPAGPAAAAPSAPAPAVTSAAPAPTTGSGSAPDARSRYRRRYAPHRSEGPADPIVPGHFDAKSGNYVYETGQPTTLKLPNGSTIANVGVNSTESYLQRFLSNPEVQVDTVDLTRGWFNFDRVFFEPGKATLTPASLGQLRNIATLLRAYPTARIKLGGYTDDTGTYKVNRELSDARARTAWASLVEMGVSPSRIEAHGYGSYYSIASNATEEGRAKNRRLSVKVLQK